MEDLSRYSVDELRRIRVQVEKEIERRRTDHLRKARREVKQIAERYGFTLSDLLEDIDQQQDNSTT